MVGVLLVALALVACAAAGSRPYDLGPELRGDDQAAAAMAPYAVELTGEVDGIAIAGLAGIAWDQHTETLFAVSDLGYLWRLRLQFDGDNVLTGIADASPAVLQGPSGAPLPAGQRDAEDIALLQEPEGEVVLLVVFEGEPRLYRYDARGRSLGAVPLPPQLAKAEHFRTANKGLEAMMVDLRWGPVVAPELPLPASAEAGVPLRAVAGAPAWWYPLSPREGSALTAMVALEQGRALFLERAFISVWVPLVITLRVAELEPDNGVLAPEQVAQFDAAAGWRIDNFEGLTRRGPQEFLMISDDNASPLQRSLLVQLALPAVTRSAFGQ